MGTSKLSDEQFLKAYDDYAQALYRHCFFRVYSAPRAEELVQETFLKTWNYLGQGKTIDNLRAFLYRTLNNLIIDESRKKKTDSLEALIEAAPSYEPSYNGTEQIESALLARQVIEVMNQLPDEARQLLTMRYIDDLDPIDIAQILQITPNNVSVRLNRATAALKKFLNI